MSLRFLPEIASHTIFSQTEKERSAKSAGKGQTVGRRSTQALPDIKPAQFYLCSPEDPGLRVAVSRREYIFNQPRIIKGFEDYGKLLSLSIEDHAAERLTAFGQDKWTRDGSALRQVIIASNADGLSGNAFNKYCPSNPTTICTSAPLWCDGSQVEYQILFETAPVPVLIYTKEPFSGFSVVGEPFKGRMRQAAVSAIIRQIPPRRTDRAVISFINDEGLFAAGYRPRLSSGVELNLRLLKLHADGSIAGYSEIS